MAQVSLRQGLVDQLEQRARQQQCSLDEVVQALLDGSTVSGPLEEPRLESEKFSQSVIAAMAEGVILQTADGRVQACNASAERILGLTAEQMIGRTPLDPLWQPIHEDGSLFSDDAHPAIITLRTGEPQSNVIMGVQRPDGRLAWVSVNTQPINQAGSSVPEAVVVTFVDITQLKQKELALRETHEQLTTILEGTADGILVLGPGAEVIYANEAAAHMFGRKSAEAMLRRTRHELLDKIEIVDEWGQPLPEDWLPGHLALEGLQPEPVTASFRLPDRDEQQWYVIKATPIFDHSGHVRFAVIATHNITERKRGQASLEQERSLLRTLIDHLPDLVYVKDRQSRYLVSNTTHTKAMGCVREDELLGKVFADFVGQEVAAPLIHNDFHVIEHGETIINREGQIVYPDGRVGWLLTTKAPLRDAAGNIIGLIGISRDITDRKEADAQGVALTIERERAQVLSDFIRDASHEFRTPLSVINTNTYLLERVQDAERQKSLIGGVRDQVTKVVRLVDGLVTMNRLERTSHENAQLLDLNEVLRIVCYAQQALADKHQLDLTMNLTPYLPKIKGDSDDIALAISEIMQNAFHFTPTGGQIMTRTYAKAHHSVIEIKDTGAGIDPVDLPRIFERFYRGDTAHTTSGFGLGLAIAHKIVTDHGGGIEVESTLDKGSTFRLLFPVPEAAS